VIGDDIGGRIMGEVGPLRDRLQGGGEGEGEGKRRLGSDNAIYPPNCPL
jgi:hypothetical protein